MVIRYAWRIRVLAIAWKWKNLAKDGRGLGQNWPNFLSGVSCCDGSGIWCGSNCSSFRERLSYWERSIGAFGQKWPNRPDNR